MNRLLKVNNKHFSSYLLVGCHCKPPDVDLQLKHSVPKSDLFTTSGGPLIVKAIATSNCLESNQTKYQWMISTVDSETTYFSPFLKYGVTNRNTISLEPSSLGAGIVYVSVEVSVSVSESISGRFSYDFGFVRIRLPDLIAKIVGPASVTRELGNVTIDGSVSYDPESHSLQSGALNFMWKCQRTCRWDPVDMQFFSKAEVEPCFGIANETNSTISTQSTATIHLPSLKSNCTYLFGLTIAKDNRVSYARHEVKIKPAVPFYVG